MLDKPCRLGRIDIFVFNSKGAFFFQPSVTAIVYSRYHVSYDYDVIIVGVTRWCTSALRSAKRAPANVRRLNNSSDVIFYCSVGERSRALGLLNAAQHNVE